MKTATIDITEEEARLLPLLYKIPLQATLEAAGQVMRQRLVVDGLIKKTREAFEGKTEEAQTPVSTEALRKPKRKRR